MKISVMNQMKGLVKMTSSFLLMLPIMTIYRNNQNSIDSIDARFSWLVAMLGASCLHGEYIGHFPTGFYCVWMLIATLLMGFFYSSDIMQVLDDCMYLKENDFLDLNCLFAFWDL
jgi:hypothetical protein